MKSNESYYNVFNVDVTENPNESFDVDPLNKYCTEEDFQSIWGDGIETFYWYGYDEFERLCEESLRRLENMKYPKDPPMNDLFNESDLKWDYALEYEK